MLKVLKVVKVLKVLKIVQSALSAQSHVSSSFWSNVSMVASLQDCSLYGKSKCQLVSELVSEWQGHLLSCFGQLKMFSRVWIGHCNQGTFPIVWILHKFSSKVKKKLCPLFPSTLVLLLPRKSSQPSGNNLTITSFSGRRKKEMEALHWRVGVSGEKK